MVGSVRPVLSKISFFATNAVVFRWSVVAVLLILPIFFLVIGAPPFLTVGFMLPVVLFPVAVRTRLAVWVAGGLAAALSVAGWAWFLLVEPENVEEWTLARVFVAYVYAGGVVILAALIDIAYRASQRLRKVD
jgi:hypothetical protein